ncbi:M23 family peptidase [Leptospira wolffii]|uniref:M23 family metallopeptidase n=1 Tax=Leptospira wolffii TaxID=409998 RepID=UPI001083FAEF|nr:M23 family metallopeptidase [Leptospira wolffii]TGK62041.1 M23 family peptidase [Leptospira wolffii]TGK68642.1 M23 family peptidase [Leptospira wolffii]TGK74574.1 M23 family peptidase [Leptospira wolffii]TGL31850.1 M23 family peptidase [Leptospira wolffii]
MEKMIKKRIDQVKEKGHQRLTVLLIPHGFDKSFHFQISIFTIFFLVGLLFAIVGIAVLGIVKYNNTRIQINALASVYGKYFDEYIEYSENLGDIRDDFTSLTENLQEIHSLVDGESEELLKLPEESDSEDLANNELKLEEAADKDLMLGRSYLSEIYGYRSVRVAMDRNRALVDSVFDFLDTRYGIMNSLPFGEPLMSYNLTSYYGMRRSPTFGYMEFHDGVDLANVPGTPIYATGDGKVYRAIYSPRGYGNHIVLAHANGYYSLYGHCTRLLVREGDYVHKNQMIGTVGATGNVTGPHVHYEVWIGESNRTDPMDYMKVGLGQY